MRPPEALGLHSRSPSHGHTLCLSPPPLALSRLPVLNRPPSRMLRVGIPSTPSPPWLLPLLLLLLCTIVQGLAVNRTIDDTRGDSVTGQAVQFLPASTVWFTSTTCTECLDVPDASLSADNTWTAALYLASIRSISVTMKFSRTAIYIFFIIPNFAAETGLESEVLCDFLIDGAKVGNFHHQSDGSGGFAYNSLVYQKTGIPNGNHVFVIQTTGTTPAVVIFDRAIYTFADDTDTKPPPPPPPSTTAALPSTTHSDDSSTSIPASSPLISSASSGSPPPFLSTPAGSLTPQSPTSFPPFYITAGGPTSSIPAIPSESSQESESNASHSTTR
ncbi:hypothetical protein C8F01DRAFT_1286723 [Mycena amicta]|nr:hypothetical protein C8F01DRAFT_1286723 [Mycena amicta]